MNIRVSFLILQHIQIMYDRIYLNCNTKYISWAKMTHLNLFVFFRKFTHMHEWKSSMRPLIPESLYT